MARALTPAELAELVRLTQERNEALARGEDLLADQQDRLRELQQIERERNNAHLIKKTSKLNYKALKPEKLRCLEFEEKQTKISYSR